MHAATAALASVAGADLPYIPVLAAFDHEENGSQADTGAQGPLLGTVLERSVHSRGGGFEDRAGSARPDRLGLNEAGERLTEGLRLALRFPGAKLVISGGVRGESENDKAAFVPRLWAGKKVDYLLNEVRKSGREDKELVDEITYLAKRYGIVTPYTAYLMAEDIVNQVPGTSPPPAARYSSRVVTGWGSRTRGTNAMRRWYPPSWTRTPRTPDMLRPWSCRSSTKWPRRLEGSFLATSERRAFGRAATASRCGSVAATRRVSTTRRR